MKCAKFSLFYSERGDIEFLSLFRDSDGAGQNATSVINRHDPYDSHDQNATSVMDRHDRMILMTRMRHL